MSSHDLSRLKQSGSPTDDNSQHITQANSQDCSSSVNPTLDIPPTLSLWSSATSQKPTSSAALDTFQKFTRQRSRRNASSRRKPGYKFAGTQKGTSKVLICTQSSFKRRLSTNTNIRTAKAQPTKKSYFHRPQCSSSSSDSREREKTVPANDNEDAKFQLVFNPGEMDGSSERRSVSSQSLSSENQGASESEGESQRDLTQNMSFCTSLPHRISKFGMMALNKKPEQPKTNKWIQGQNLSSGSSSQSAMDASKTDSGRQSSQPSNWRHYQLSGQGGSFNLKSNGEAESLRHFSCHDGRSESNQYFKRSQHYSSKFQLEDPSPLKEGDMIERTHSVASNNNESFFGLNNLSPIKKAMMASQFNESSSCSQMSVSSTHTQPNKGFRDNRLKALLSNSMDSSRSLMSGSQYNDRMSRMRQKILGVQNIEHEKQSFSSQMDQSTPLSSKISSLSALRKELAQPPGEDQIMKGELSSSSCTHTKVLTLPKRKTLSNKELCIQTAGVSSKRLSVISSSNQLSVSLYKRAAGKFDRHGAKRFSIGLEEQILEDIEDATTEKGALNPHLLECQSAISSVSNQSMVSNQEMRLRAIRIQSIRLSEQHTKQKENNFESKYVLGDKIGEGQHSQVFKCFKSTDKHQKQPLAVKVVREDDEEKKQATRTEFGLTRTLNHPNVISSIELFENDLKGEMHLVLKHAEGQDFGSYLLKNRVDHFQAKAFLKQILSGLEYLHQKQGIVHRDVKPDNFIITKEGQLYLIDFNVSRRWVEGTQKLLTRTGTPWFNAPEIYAGNPYDNKVDVWSAGVIFYLMITGCLPFPEENVPRLIKNIQQQDPDFSLRQFKNMEPASLDLLQRMLAKDPSQRPTSRECLQHPWLYEEKPLWNFQEYTFARCPNEPATSATNYEKQSDIDMTSVITYK